MKRKVDFVWELPLTTWRWEASHYEGNGIFFGKVSSPFVPKGEYGNWYLWEIEQEGAILVKGDKTLLAKIRIQSQKKKRVQNLFGGI